MAVFVSEQKLAETRGLTIGQVRDIKARLFVERKSLWPVATN